MTEDTPEYNEGLQKIFEMAEDLAKQERICLTAVTFDEHRPPVTSDYHVLSLTSGSCTVSEKLHQEELGGCGRPVGSMTEAKIRSAIERLKTLLET